jgi:hypothetical protein
MSPGTLRATRFAPRTTCLAGATNRHRGAEEPIVQCLLPSDDARSHHSQGVSIIDRLYDAVPTGRALCPTSVCVLRVGSPPGPSHSSFVPRKADGTVTALDRCCTIITEGGWLGDHANPILKPEAAEAVRRFGELVFKGIVAQDLHNSCWPEPPPYVMGLHFGVLILPCQLGVRFLGMFKQGKTRRDYESAAAKRVPKDLQLPSVPLPGVFSCSYPVHATLF